MPDERLDIHRESATGPSPPEPWFEDQGEAPDFRFTLYICGATEKSQTAVANARRLCDEHLLGRYALEIVDLYRQPELAQLRDIFAIPTLIRELPRPLRRFIGDLSENERLVVQMTLRRVLDR
jgi:circadian clock protein KaiB